MPPAAFLRIHIEVVTREDLTTPLSIENMLFQLCEHLQQRTAIVQLHIVDRAESLAQLAAGPDAIPHTNRIEIRMPGSFPELGHTANLYLACSALDAGNELHRPA